MLTASGMTSLLSVFRSVPCTPRVTWWTLSVVTTWTRCGGSCLLAAAVLLPLGAAVRGEPAPRADLAPMAAMFAAGDARAVVQDGPLLGTATEHTERRADGGLSIARRRTYARARDPDTGKVIALPEPWEATSRLEVSPALRLLQVHTQASFHRSAERVFGKGALHDALPALFEVDRTTLTAAPGGGKLDYRAYLGKQQLEHERYDYDRDLVPLEIVGLYLSSELSAGRRAFGFELLVAGNSSDGVDATVHTTRDLRPYAKGYGLPAARIAVQRDVLVVDMRLSSLIKRLFFPHHFYMVFAADDPSRLLMLWGGDPDVPLQAFRIP